MYQRHRSQRYKGGDSGYPSVPQGPEISAITKFESKAQTPTSDHIWYDITMNNTYTNQTVPANYTVNLTQSIIDNPQDYYVTVARMEISTYTVPLFNFPNNTYSVCLTYGGTDYFTYVPFINGSTIPNPDQTVFGYQIFIDMVNSALSTAWTALITAHPSAPGYAGSPPTLILNTTTNIISLIASQGSFTPDNGSGTTIYFNQELFQYFNSLPNVFNGYGTTNGKDFSLTVKNNFNNYYPTGATGSGGPSTSFPLTNSWELSQEAPTLGFWSDFQSLAVTTSTIPIQKEYLPQSSVTSGSTLSGAINYKPILTDFHPDITGSPVNFTPLQYTAEVFRWVDLLGSTPLDKIDAQIYWVDYSDVFHPLYLAPGATATIKLLFRRKGISD